MAAVDFTIPVLGEAKIPSPIEMSNTFGDKIANYVRDEEVILHRVDMFPDADGEVHLKDEFLQKAGPRQNLYFHPPHVHAGIVTCGGLCPGLNDVIRSVVRSLWHRYGVKRISGIRYGYKGFLPEYNFPIMELNPDVVDDIHKIGGTILGSSRGGGERTSEIVDAIERMNLNILFTIGGDGTQKGSLLIAKELEKRGLKVAVVGIPKTIDNDLSYIQRSFGFETAVARASDAVSGAHVEAHSSMNGIGLVKLMGRESGFIAAQTALAVNEANFVLVPEVPFDLEGERGLFSCLRKRLEKRLHAVIIVAEGAGQNLMDETEGADASGNRKLADIGLFLKQRISEYFAGIGMEVNIKYIDPSYMVRSAPAEPNDSVYCSRLGTNAVHAAMAGKTRTVVGLVNDVFVHLPTEVVVAKRNTLDPESSLWRDVISATQQPVLMRNE